MKYDVHMYVLCRIKVSNVEADNQQEAIKAAEASVNPYQLLPDRTSDSRPDEEMAVEFGGYAEEVDSFLVDEVGDEEHERSTAYDADGVPFPDQAVKMVVRR